MSRSLVTTSIAGLLILALTIASFVLGTTVKTHAAASSFTLINSQVRFEPAAAPDPEQLDDTQTNAGIVPMFVYQGVLNDSNGDPVIGPVDLSFSLYSNGFIIFEHASVDTSVTPDAFGRFQVDVPLGDSQTMSGYADLFLEIRETGGVLIANIPVQYTPRAWYSDHARTSISAESAVYAQDAELALHANTATQADELTNDQFYPIELGPNFSDSPTGQSPTATRIGDMVFLTGTIVNDVANPGGQIIGTLPPGMRPSTNAVMAVHVALSSSSGNTAVTVSPDGTISLFSPAYPAGLIIFLNGASFVVD